MRIVLALFFVAHGIAHLAGLKVSPRGQAAIWAVLAAGCAVTAAGLLLQTSWWMHLAVGTLVLSMSLCLFRWPETRFGVAANVVLLLGVVPAIAMVREGQRLEADLASLWTSSATTDRRILKPADFDALPEPARRLLTHAIAPGTPAASAVHVKMHGEIKLKQWLPFTSEQVIDAERGMIWAASTKMFGLPVQGSDRIVDGQGAMRWVALGLIPVQQASGPDIRRSAIGRLQGELLWLPPALTRECVTWSAPDPSHAVASFETFGQRGEVVFEVDPHGRILSVRFRRWGSPGGGAFTEADFGGSFSAERTFGGYTIPTKMRMGWYFGSGRFEMEGEFFRAEIREASFR